MHPILERGSNKMTVSTVNSVAVPANAKLSGCVIFATKGRPEILSEVVETLARQTLQPSLIIISATSEADVSSLSDRKDIVFLTGTTGLTSQRNAALRAVPEHIDFVAFFDDDFVPHPDWLNATASAFERFPDVGSVTGHLLYDGASGKELPFNEALTILREPLERVSEWIRDDESPYGCNMAFRRSAIRGLEFDERLVLIGWLEDRDYGARVAERGNRLVKIGNALGVHRGVKQAKGTDRSLGYAQVVNAVYLHRKGTMSTLSLLRHLTKQIFSNLVWLWYRASSVDRVGRLKGNLLGLRDVLDRTIDPERARDL